MGKRQKQWARRARAELTLALGGKCSACGTLEDLQFDCDSVDGGAHHSYPADKRICFYRAQARLGHVRLLCWFCNALKGGVSLDVWRTALSTARDSETIMRGSYTPGRGPTLTPAWFRGVLSAHMSRYHAEVRARAKLKSLSFGDIGTPPR
jgi:hypothetical protein